MKFSIGILQRDTHPHVACFEDVAFAIRDSLKALGHEIVEPGTAGARHIAFGANHLQDPTGELKKAGYRDTIWFNTEQVAAVARPHSLISNRELVGDDVIWDYSRTNIEALKGLGFKRVVHCPVGYIETMSRIEPAPKEVDVLFYGAPSPRRLAVLRGLKDVGLTGRHLFGVYGAERDYWIARAKVVLNVHVFANPVFEIFRVSHLLANKACVVSEDGGQDEQLEAVARHTTFYVHYDELVGACQELCSTGWYLAKANNGARWFRENTSMVSNVRKALEESRV